MALFEATLLFTRHPSPHTRIISMTLLAIVTLSCILIYIGFLLYTSSLSTKYSVISAISATLFKSSRGDVRISTVIINDTKNAEDRQAGLAILGSKTVNTINDLDLVTNDLILPLTQLEILSVINILKVGAPLIFTLGDKKEFKMVMDEHPDKAKILFNTSALFRQVYVVNVSKSDIEQLITGFELLLKDPVLQTSPSK